MGPDEYPTRDELGVVVKFLQAQVNHQSEMVTTLVGLLALKGVLKEDAVNEWLRTVKESDSSARVQRCTQNLREFEAIHNILKKYEDPSADL